MRDLSDHIEESVSGRRIEEVLDPATMAQLKKELATPDIRPQTFDVSVEGWFARLELWGKVKIKHSDPENRVKEEITKSQLLRILSDDNLLKMFGKWHVEDISINKVSIYRDYIGMDGRQYREEFVVDIELKDELKKAVKGKGLFGWF
jgi:hypothetical protein